MDALAERTGRAYRLVEYSGHPEADPGHRRHGLRRRHGPRDRRRRSPPPASGSACCRSGSTGRSRQPSSSPRCRPRWSAIAVLDRTKEPGSNGEPLFLDVVSSLSEAHADGELASDAARHRRPLRPVVQGVHAGHGRRDLRRAGRRVAPASGSPSASPTTSAARACRTTPTSTSRTRATLRAVFYGIGSDGTVGANKNTDQDPRPRTRRCTPRPTSSTTRRSPAG